MPTNELRTGIKTTGADTYVATHRAAEDVDGVQRVVQIISMTAGKVSESMGPANRTVSIDDTEDITSITGDIPVGDDYYFACYVRHSQPNGYCLVTPLLCDKDQIIMGLLDTKVSEVTLPLASGTNYISRCLSWEIAETGSWYIYPHICNLSDSNSIDMWCFTF